jgi:hypothetical protein
MLNQDKVQKLRYWIMELEAIRVAKEAGQPAPWSEDVILNTYRFCNVRREDDRVSKWLIDNVFLPNSGNDLLFFQAICARWINWPPTIQYLMEQRAWPTLWFNPDHFGRLIDERYASGEKTYTGAYMIRGDTSGAVKQKGIWLAHSTLQPIYAERNRFLQYFRREDKTIEGAHRLFNGYFNFGSFMAGQCVADWTYTHLLNTASDLYTWAPVGPGSSRGMNWLQDRNMEATLKQEQFVEELQELTTLLPIKLSAHNVQNTLCELSKYVRVENGGAPPRSKYTPETRF